MAGLGEQATASRPGGVHGADHPKKVPYLCHAGGFR